MEMLDVVPLIDDALAMQPKNNFTLGGVVKDLAGFAIGMHVLGKASEMGAGAIFKTIAARNKGLSEVILKNAGIEKEAALNIGSLFRGVTHTLADAPEGVFNITTKEGAHVMEAMSSASRSILDMGKFTKSAYTDWSSSGSLLKKGVAGFGKSMYHSLPLAAGMYGLQRATGLGEQQDQPAWYNVPGHVWRIAKDTANFAAFDVGTGWLRKAGGAVKNVASQYLSQEASPGLHAFMDNHFAINRGPQGAKAGSFLQTVLRSAAVMDGIRSASKTFSGSVMDTFMDNWGNSAKRSEQQSALFNFRDQGYRRTLRNQTLDAFKSGYKSRMESLHNYRSDFGHDFVTSMTDLIAKHHDMSGAVLESKLKHSTYDEGLSFLGTLKRNTLFHNHSIIEGLQEAIHTANQDAGKSMGGNILGRQTASVKDMMTGADTKVTDLIFHHLKDLSSHHPSATKAFDNLKDNFLAMKAGPSIFKSTTGVIDYSMYSPKNLASAFISFINPYFTVGALGRELPLVKIMGLDHYLAREGLGIHSIRADEGQRYYDTERKGMRTVGDALGSSPIGNLGGILIKGKLFVTNSQGFLEEANAAKQKMVYSTPYSRDAILTKLNAQGADSRLIDKTLDVSNEVHKRGMAEKFNDFGSRWGLHLPSPIHGVLESLNRSFGFSPMKTGVKEAVNKFLDPRSSVASIGGDINAFISSVGYMSDKASKSLYRSLSDPSMIRTMARLSKHVGGDAADRVAALEKAFSGTDQELMDIVRGRGNFQNDETLRYAVEHNRHFNNYSMNEQMSENKFSFRERPLTHRQEIQRKLLSETLGMVGLPGENSKLSFNLVDHMLKDPELLGNMSAENIKHLQMVGTHVDLFRFGYLDGSGRYVEKHNIQHDAMQIIRNRLKDNQSYLEEKLFDTPMIKRIGVFGFGPGRVSDRRGFINAYSEYLKDSNYSKVHGSPFLMTSTDSGLSGIGFHVNTFLDRVMDMGNHLGLTYGTADRRPYNFKIPRINASLFGTQFTVGGGKGVTLGGPMASMLKRVAQGVGILAAGQAIDTFTSTVPIFQGTMFANGTYSAAADVYVKGSMAFHKVQDLTGITQAAKYLEGLMPSSTSTIPGMVLGGMMHGPLGILPGAVINRFMAVNGVTPSFDKSYDDMKETYSGRELVPVRKSRFWLFGKSPYEGDAPQYFRPHWYPRLKSDYKHTDTLYGSKAEAFLYAPWAGLGYNPIAQVLDKYHYERKHYWDRPYPVSAPAWSEVPVIGKILSATIGRLPIIGKPLKYMHHDEMSHYFSTSGNTTETDGEMSTSRMPTPSQSEQYMYMDQVANTNSGAALYGSGRPKNMNPYGAMTVMGESLYGFTEMAGLRGYQLESLMGGGLADTHPRLSTASDMWSARRAFWDMNAGDIFGSTEFFRRFVPKEKKIWEKVNPLRNRFPNWLPSEENDYFMDFLSGDPYCISFKTNVLQQYGKYKIAGDIKEGDIIYTHKGNWLPVKKIVKRKINDNEKSYSLKIAGINNISLEFSEEHPIFIKKVNYCSFGSSCICRPIRNFNKLCDNSNNKEWLGRGRYPRGCKNTWIKEDINFIPVKDVRVGDYTVYKIPQENNNIELKYYYFQRDAKRSPEYEIYGNIILDEDLSWVLGLYISEGSTGKNKSKKPLQLIFSMNRNEVSIQEKINKIIYTKFGIKGVITIKDESSQLVFSSTKIAQIFNNWIPGNLYEKVIPDFIFDTNNSNKIAFLFGCYLGDGHITDKRLIYECANQKIVFGLRRLSFELGIPASYNDRIRTDKRTQKETKSFITEIHVFNIKDFDLMYLDYKKDIIDLNFDRLPNIDNFSDGDYVYQRVIGKEEIILDYVYGFEVDIDDSFCVMDFATHNTKIQEGEMRLPGNAYNKLYDVKRTFPGRSSGFGNTVLESVREMTGLSEPFDDEADDVTAAGTAMHRYIQASMMRSNVGIKAEQLVYDAKDDISGHVDLIMHDPYRKDGKRVLEIKTVNGKKFAGIKSPVPHHISQVNFYLRQLHLDVGTLLYINRDDPSQIRTFDVRYNEQRFRKDLKDLNKARKIAAGIVAKGQGYETGTSYSWLDRLRILADVAPYSKEYNDASQIVAMQIRENKITEQDKAEVAKIKQRRQAVMRKFDLYPTRFRGRVFNPDTNYELLSENTNIKAAANYSVGERLMGAVWERAIQMDTPLNMKLWNYKSPLQHYKSTKIYGTEAAAWNKPYQDILHPMMTKALSADNPLDAAASFGWIGGLGMGGMGNMSLPGAAFGAMYGAARKVIGDDAWIPDEIKKKRDIVKTFDQLKYVKAMQLYEQTGDAQYRTQADETMWNISHSGYEVGTRQAMRAMPAFEKPYFLAWMQETNPIERKNILKMVPTEVGNLLKAKWGLSYDTPSPSNYTSMVPNSDWEGLLPQTNLDDIELKTINQEGLRATDFGLGWYDQQRRISSSNADLKPVNDVKEVLVSNHAVSKVKNALMQSLRSVCRHPLVAISITPGSGHDSVKITLNLMRDRYRDIQNSLKAR